MTFLDCLLYFTPCINWNDLSLSIITKQKRSLQTRCPLVFLQNEPRVLEKPIVVQSVATNGRLFQFVVFQLNTTDLQSDSGVKNLVWVDEDQPLYEFAKVRPFIKKKVVKVKSRVPSDTFTLSIKIALYGLPTVEELKRCILTLFFISTRLYCFLNCAVWCRSVCYVDIQFLSCCREITRLKRHIWHVREV